MSEIERQSDDRLLRALRAHRKVNPDAYKPAGLSRREEEAMEAALAAAEPSELAERLAALLRDALAYPRFLSIGSVDNVVELRINREKYDEIHALLGTEAISVGI